MNKENELTDSELESCWYCDQCEKPMRENDDGYIRHNIGFCSDNCADDYDNKFQP